MRLKIICAFSLLVPSLASAQAPRPYAPLSQSQFVSLAERCASGVPAETLLAIARTESGLNPNAISINRPKAAACLAGHADGELILTKQPKDRREAESWLHWLSAHRYTVSIGLMQVNVEMAPQFHVRPEQLLEPCTNLRLAAAILVSLYTGVAREIGEGFDALDVALSLYNTGDPNTGVRNGYVANVYAHADRRTSLLAH
jgi:type IV secretion system protein VirB1